MAVTVCQPKLQRRPTCPPKPLAKAGAPSCMLTRVFITSVPSVSSCGGIDFAFGRGGVGRPRHWAAAPAAAPTVTFGLFPFSAGSARLTR